MRLFISKLYDSAVMAWTKLVASDKARYLALYPSLSILTLMGALAWLVMWSGKQYIRVSTIGLYTDREQTVFDAKPTI